MIVHIKIHPLMSIPETQDWNKSEGDIRTGIAKWGGGGGLATFSCVLKSGDDKLSNLTNKQKNICWLQSMRYAS